MISCVKASSIKEAPAAIMLRAANCPAEVTFAAESREASKTLRPIPEACMPKAKETAK